MHRACEGCSRAGEVCYKPQTGRRTACRRCSQNKKSCLPGGSKSKSKGPAAGSSKSKDYSEEAHEYSAVELIQELRQELVELRGELLGLRRGQSKLIADNAFLKERFDQIEALLLGKQAKRKGKAYDYEDMDITN